MSSLSSQNTKLYFLCYCYAIYLCNCKFFSCHIGLLKIILFFAQKQVTHPYSIKIKKEWLTLILVKKNSVEISLITNCRFLFSFTNMEIILFSLETKCHFLFYFAGHILLWERERKKSIANQAISSIEIISFFHHHVISFHLLLT